MLRMEIEPECVVKYVPSEWVLISSTIFGAKLVIADENSIVSVPFFEMNFGFLISGTIA